MLGLVWVYSIFEKGLPGIQSPWMQLFKQVMVTVLRIGHRMVSLTLWHRKNSFRVVKLLAHIWHGWHWEGWWVSCSQDSSYTSCWGWYPCLYQAHPDQDMYLPLQCCTYSLTYQSQCTLIVIPVTMPSCKLRWFMNHPAGEASSRREARQTVVTAKPPQLPQV